ncbi:MAG: MFS transporter [Burkholderiales bacterium]|nr:MFS transporter [Burkholderiales bacterium]
MSDNYLRRIYLRLAGAVMLVVMAALLANAFLSHRTFERALAPQLGNKMASVGGSISALVLKAVENGVPYKELYGVNERFQEVKSEMPEVAYLALTDAGGAILHQSMAAPEGAAAHFAHPATLKLLEGSPGTSSVQRVGDLFMVSLPVASAERKLGMLHMGVDLRFVDDMVLDMLLDVLVVLVVALFFTLELMHFIAGARLDASLRDLGETFERGSAGNFVIPVRGGGADQAFGGLLKALDGVLARLNDAYETLARELERSRHVPTHERHPGMRLAHQGAAELAGRFRFGRARQPELRDVSELAKVRAPLFVFILAEELTRSFLPGYVNDLLVPVPGISNQILIGLPIALFMLIVAVAQPFLGVHCERIGHRRTMLWGATVAAAGFLASALAHSVLDLLLWRSLCAIGYAMVFVAAQSYVLDHAPRQQRAKSFALFVGAIMAATVCGPSIGGILADNVGVRPTLVIAAVLAMVSILVIRQLPDNRPRQADEVPARIPTWREFAALVFNRRFMTVTGLAAMPAKMLLTGICFYLLPLHLVQSGSTQSMAGRLLMVYAVVMVLVGPLAATLAVSRERMHWLVGGGLVVSGLGGAAVLAGAGVGWILLAVLLIGLGQSMSISAQSALVAEHCAEEIARLGDGVVYGVYRLLERIGNALGPVVAAALVMHFDYQIGFVAIGAVAMVAGLAFLAVTRQPPAAALATV